MFAQDTNRVPEIDSVFICADPQRLGLVENVTRHC